MKAALETSVQSFFSSLNWDNRPQLNFVGPMEFSPLGTFLASIPWTGDPATLAEQALSNLTASEALETAEDNVPTLSDLFSMF
ncbi:MAG: hypothetical protein HC921_14265 [Synechococcaceae cyanobacterium SM2_3_1]|nr:hypothetical protein [Synechococcaceae cyanobacterium SM2_3_1]